MSPIDRREFVKTAAGALAAEHLMGPMTEAQTTTPTTNRSGNQADADGMIYRTLGRTGERVSAIGMGGYRQRIIEGGCAAATAS